MAWSHDQSLLQFLMMLFLVSVWCCLSAYRWSMTFCLDQYIGFFLVQYFYSMNGRIQWLNRFLQDLVVKILLSYHYKVKQQRDFFKPNSTLQTVSKKADHIFVSVLLYLDGWGILNIRPNDLKYSYYIHISCSLNGMSFLEKTYTSLLKYTKFWHLDTMMH